MQQGSPHVSKRSIMAMVFAFMFTSVSFGQTITGNVGGTVTDTSGAVVVGAKVTATNVDTGVKVNTATNKQGIYSIRFLQIGHYKVQVEAPGFRAQSYGPFVLEVQQTAEFNAKLTVGSQSAQVEVSGTLLPLLNTENGTIATTLDSYTIESVPLDGRNFAQLALYTPGAVSPSVSAFGGQLGTERSTNGQTQPSINGNRQQQNNYILDGIEINQTISNSVGYNPSPDAVSEIKIISANAPAEYGNVNGGDIISVTKSGTNRFHGSAFMFMRDQIFDANTWGNKDHVPGQVIPRNPYAQTIFGGTLGGPILRNKLFFFVDYEGVRRHNGGLASASVLSAKMRTGDFSELLDPAIMCSRTGGVCANQSSLIQLYNPDNGFAKYVNNQVPITSSAAAYLIAHPELYPLPNATPTPNFPVANNYTGASKSQDYNNQGDIKVDWVPTQNDRIFVRWLMSTAGDSSVSPLAVTFPGASVYPTKGLAINYVRMMTPSIVNEFRAGFTRTLWLTGIPYDRSGGFGLKGNSLLGIPASQPYPGFSELEPTGLTSMGNYALVTVPANTVFDYSDNLTWQHGKHLTKAGVQFLRYQENNFYPGNDGAMGYFTYNGNFTGNPAIGNGSKTVKSGAGYGPADFVLDRAYFLGTGSVEGPSGQRQWRSAAFLQDDWKLLPNLTVNLGLRYEYDQPIYEVHNKQANVNLVNGTVEFAGSIPASAPAGSTICPTRACYTSTYANFEPRVGFSYQPTARFVVRAGYGVTTFMEGTGANLRLTYNPPFEPSFEATGTAPTTTSAGKYFPVESGFTSGGNPNYGGTTYRAYAQGLRPAFIGEYSLTTEYQISNVSSLTIGYVGESGQHLVQAVALNQLHQPCYQNGVLQANPNTTYCATADPAPYQALVSQNGNIVGTVSEGMMNYNALQTTLNQHLSRGLSFRLNYTFSRGMTNTLGFFGVSGVSGSSAYAENAYNNSAEYGPNSADVRNNASGTMVYTLPIGRGQLLGNRMGGLMNEIVGGWKVSGTGIAYSGFPLTINSNVNNAYTNNKTQRANHNGVLHIVHRSFTAWFGTDPSVQTAYTQATAGTYGNAVVGSERSPGFQQYNFSLFKDFAIVREQKIGFRVDAFNALNLTSLGNPGIVAGTTSFGQITSVRSMAREVQFSAKYQF